MPQIPIPLRTDIQDFLIKEVAIGWLTSGEVGSADSRAWGGYSDAAVQLLKLAVAARFPNYAPADGLGPLGGDSKLIQGPYESDDSFRIRLGDRWNSHARRGQPAEMLAQLWYGGYSNGAIITQNGLAYQLSAAPTPGVDPTALLVITTLPATPVPLTPVAPSVKTIPAGTPFWIFDGLTDFCSRFAVLFPVGAGPFMTCGTATFTNTDSATVTWNNAQRFIDASYLTKVGGPVMSLVNGSILGEAPESIWEDGTQRTATGTVINASAPWYGTVFVVAFPIGANPYANLSASDLSRLQVLIQTWRPAAKTCVQVSVLVHGRFWDWPIAHWNDAGLTWGPSDTVIYQGA